MSLFFVPLSSPETRFGARLAFGRLCGRERYPTNGKTGCTARSVWKIFPPPSGEIG